ncbi:MAG: hypothetical protein PF574_02625 [Candidatus Delongbacteria bacterium]|jgi:hypothetical protein|nr:hypothetical protein [Candidatus Delongbacteria bacterium]
MNLKYNSLRTKFPTFIYEGFSYIRENSTIRITFQFIQSTDIIFNPELIIPFDKNIDIEDLEVIIFNIGMIELISYYKACCSPKIVIKAGYLNEKQLNFWNTIYFNGLGEFLYTNQIETTPDELFNFKIDSDRIFKPLDSKLDDDCIIPVGGGKDSVVTLELLKNESNNIPFILNPRDASIDSVKSAGYKDHIAFQRKLDTKLFELNKEGYLNGHTPFSALLAFISTLAAFLYKKKNIVLSNENSASEGNVQFSGIEVNHQYSKSFEAEKALHDYISEYIHPEINYFSFLRPIYELKIAEFFSKYKDHFSGFRSCNVGSKKNIWCCNCPKCLFTYIILAPFIPKQEMVNIFGEDLLNKKELEGEFIKLLGDTDIKPFECVGTHREIKAALAKTIVNYTGEELPYLLKSFSEKYSSEFEKMLMDYDILIKFYSRENLLNEKFNNILFGKM